MTENELAALLSADGELVTERLDRWAKIDGDHPFLHYGETGQTFNFGDFTLKSNYIAGNLNRLGIGKGDHVSVLCNSSMVAALAMFGIWKAGAVYCPINFSYTGRLLEYQLNDTRPRLVISEASFVPALDEIIGALADRPILALYTDNVNEQDVVAHNDYRQVSWEELIQPCGTPDVELRPNDLANLIYTSGTTGPAKGVLQTHRWMAQYTYLVRRLSTREDVVYNDLPLYHVGGAVFNVCRAAWVGCQVVTWDRFSPNMFWQRIAQYGATSAVLLDVMIPWLAKASPAADDRYNTLNKVHMQPLPLDHATFSRRFGIDHVTAAFGQTESGASLLSVIRETQQGDGTPLDLYRGLDHRQIDSMLEEIGIPLLAGQMVTRKGLMGAPSPFVEVSVRREDDTLCDPEEVGELALRSKLPNVFIDRYYNKPEATLAAFRNLMFHTGDSAVLGQDGLFYFSDRLGDRIRVRGENLSSQQVEDLLNRHEGVGMCAVVGVPSGEGYEDDIAAFIVPAGPGSIDEDMLRTFTAATMPKYMRPKYVQIVADLPRTPTNKVEKYKLRALLELGAPFEKPPTSTAKL